MLSLYGIARRSMGTWTSLALSLTPQQAAKMIYAILASDRLTGWDPMDSESGFSHVNLDDSDQDLNPDTARKLCNVFKENGIKARVNNNWQIEFSAIGPEKLRKKMHALARELETQQTLAFVPNYESEVIASLKETIEKQSIIIAAQAKRLADLTGICPASALDLLDKMLKYSPILEVTDSRQCTFNLYVENVLGRDAPQYEVIENLRSFLKEQGIQLDNSDVYGEMTFQGIGTKDELKKKIEEIKTLTHESPLIASLREPEEKQGIVTASKVRKFGR